MFWSKTNFDTICLRETWLYIYFIREVIWGVFFAFLRSFRLRAAPGNGVGQYLRLPALLFLGRRGGRCGGLHGSVPAGTTVLPQPRLVLEAGGHRALVSCGYFRFLKKKKNLNLDLISYNNFCRGLYHAK